MRFCWRYSNKSSGCTEEGTPRIFGTACGNGNANKLFGGESLFALGLKYLQFVPNYK